MTYQTASCMEKENSEISLLIEPWIGKSDKVNKAIKQAELLFHQETELTLITLEEEIKAILFYPYSLVTLSNNRSKASLDLQEFLKRIN